jgi:hypothetical protein
MQPIVVMERGIVRFKTNEIVRRLVDSNVIDLNKVAMMSDVPIEDVEQFWQLLGYSVSGYGDLSFVRRKTLASVDACAAALIKSGRKGAVAVIENGKVVVR